MQDINIKTEPKPSKLYFYQRFYEDLENYEKKIDKFSVTDFACGGSKVLGIVKPHYYQGVDLKENMILESRNVYSKFNYNFHSADITSFNSGVKTNFGLCIQTFGINLNFNQKYLIKTLKNLNNHTQKNGSIVFNMTSELYGENKVILDKFFKDNFEKINFIFYGIFNERYNHKFARILVRIEHFLSFTSFFKKYVYIKCIKKK